MNTIEINGQSFDISEKGLHLFIVTPCRNLRIIADTEITYLAIMNNAFFRDCLSDYKKAYFEIKERISDGGKFTIITDNWFFIDRLNRDSVPLKTAVFAVANDSKLHHVTNILDVDQIDFSRIP